MSNKKQSYVDTQIDAIAEAEEIDHDQAKQEYLKRSEHVVRFDNLPPQDHIWVDRGLVLSCEGANHANHRAFKRR
jgi:hypothetical protein